MNRPVAVMRVKMMPLPRRHRIAHLRALLRRQPAGSLRGEQLAALLHAEMTARPAGEDRPT